MLIGGRKPIEGLVGVTAEVDLAFLARSIETKVDARMTVASSIAYIRIAGDDDGRTVVGNVAAVPVVVDGERMSED